MVWSSGYIGKDLVVHIGNGAVKIGSRAWCTLSHMKLYSNIILPQIRVVFYCKRYEDSDLLPCYDVKVNAIYTPLKHIGGGSV